MFLSQRSKQSPQRRKARKDSQSNNNTQQAKNKQQVIQLIESRGIFSAALR
jgi:hypothetical protein